MVLLGVKVSSVAGKKH